jgi:hypothetical protein
MSTLVSCLQIHERYRHLQSLRPYVWVQSVPLTGGKRFISWRCCISTYFLVFLSQYSEIGHANIFSLYFFIIVLYSFCGRVSWVATPWVVRGSNPVCENIFPTHPDRPRGQPSFLYNWHRFSFLKVKRPGPVFDHVPTPGAEVKETVELYLHPPLCACIACYRLYFAFPIFILTSFVRRLS